MPPPESALDVAVAALATSLILLSFLSSAAVLHLRLCLRPSTRLRRLNALWPVRLLLLLFASLWTLSELLRLPRLRRRLSCTPFILSSYALGEPCFLATLLFLLRATTLHAPPPFSAALAAALLSSLPFLVIHLLLLSNFSLGLPHSFSRPTPTDDQCYYPLFGSVLLAGLGVVYVPLFVSAGWSAVSVVINKRLRARLYALVGTVVVAVSVQVAALVLSALWEMNEGLSQWMGFMAFVAVFVCAGAAEVILVVRPYVDALAVRKADEVSGEVEEDGGRG